MPVLFRPAVFAALQVPPADTSKYIESFRLQKLRADTLYTVQVRCKNAHCGPYWSDWSSNVTKRTPEDSGLDSSPGWVLLDASPR